MRCGDVIATLKERDGRELLIPWSHYKALSVLLTDGSIASLPVCSDCHAKIEPSDFETFTKKLRYEWMRQQIIHYRHHPDKDSVLRHTGELCKQKTIERKI